MTGWTQFTVRFDTERDAQRLVEHMKDSDIDEELRFPYAEYVGRIARLRMLGYRKHEEAVRLLEEYGPFDTALVADFNDTSDGGTITAYGCHEESGAAFSRTEISCPSAMRWSFSLRFDGLMETGVRAGRDTPIEYIYADEQ